MRSTLSHLLAVVLVAAAAGCDEQFEIVDVSPEDAGVPVAVQDSFDRTCAYSGCHDAAGRVGGLSLAPVDSLAIVDGSSAQSELPMVTLGWVEESYLAVKMLPEEMLRPGVTRVGTLMPPNPTPDEQLDMAIILGWIAGAALPATD